MNEPKCYFKISHIVPYVLLYDNRLRSTSSTIIYRVIYLRMEHRTTLIALQVQMCRVHFMPFQIVWRHTRHTRHTPTHKHTEGWRNCDDFMRRVPHEPPNRRRRRRRIHSTHMCTATRARDASITYANRRRMAAAQRASPSSSISAPPATKRARASRLISMRPQPQRQCAPIRMRAN